MGRRSPRARDLIMVNASLTPIPELTRDDALGLLDGDAAVQCTLELLGEHLGIGQGALLEDRDGGDVGHRLHDLDVPFLQRQVGLTEDVERTQHRAAQTHGERVA